MTDTFFKKIDPDAPRQALTILAEIAILAVLAFAPVLYVLQGGRAVLDAVITPHWLNPIPIVACAVLLRRYLRGVWIEPLIFPAYLERGGWRVWTWTTQVASALRQSSRLRGRIGLALAAYFGVAGAIWLLNPLKPGMLTAYYPNAEWQGAAMYQAQEPFSGAQRLQLPYPLLDAPYSVEWSGSLWIAETAAYECTVLSAKNTELRIDGQVVIVIQDDTEYLEHRATVTLERGFHAVRLRYALSEGLGAVQAFVSPPNRATGQAGTPLADVEIYPDRPSMNALRISRVVNALLTALLAVGSLAGLWGILLLGSLCSLTVPRLLPVYIGLIIVLSIVVAHFFLSDITTSFDSVWSIPTALSILHEGNTDLDEYAALRQEHDNYYITRIDGHTYTEFPIGVSIVAVPVVWLWDVVLDNLLAIDITNLAAHQVLPRVEQCVATLSVAATALCCFGISRRQGVSRVQSLVIVYIFAFCSPAWSTASRALWQHGPSMLMLALAILLAVRAEASPRTGSRHVRFMSLPLAFAYVIRPTNSIAILALTAYVLLRHRKEFVPYCVWSLVVAVPFLAYNLSLYGAVLSPYYLPGRIGRNPHFWEALAGQMVSPARGLLVFSPVFLASFYGMWRAWTTRWMPGLSMALVGTLIGHWLVIASFPVWWGGHSFGPRFWADMIPILVFFLPPAFRQIGGMHGLKKQIVVGFIAACVAFSTVVQYQGATTWKVYVWNTYPVDVALKLWDFRDLQFVQGFR